jgi:carnitine-CoA ligase
MPALVSARTVSGALAEQAGLGPERPFVNCGNGWVSYGEIDARSDALAGGLAGLGLQRGDRVAVLCPSTIQIVELLFAAAKLGAVIVPLNAYLKGDFLSYQLIDSEPKVLVTDLDGYQAAAGALAQTSVVHTVLIGPAGSATDILSYADLAVPGRPVVKAETGPDDLLAISYTSGTTGMPKGCMLSHGYYTVMHRGHCGPPGDWFADGDVVMTTTPLYNAGGHGLFLMIALCAGIPTIFEPEFHASTFIGRCREEGVTVTFMTGMAAVALLARPPSPRDRDHRLRITSWVPIAPAHRIQIAERFGVDAVQGQYGQTERVPMSVMPYPFPPDKAASSGRPVPDVEVLVVDEDDRAVPAGEVGEIVVRPRISSGLFSGYWRRPEDTLRSRRNLWHHTGDAGQFDADGFLRFVDRKKDAMRRRGYNVSSAELEQAITLHPNIAAAATYPVASALSEDDIMAAIVLEDDTGLTPEEFFEFIRGAVPYYAIPRYVDIRDRLPVNALQRVMKDTLRAQAVTSTTWDLEALGLVVAKADRRRSAGS